MIDRRKFLLSSLAASLGVTLPYNVKSSVAPGSLSAAPGSPVIISTWDHGIPANEAAYQSLLSGGSILDAVEAGVRISEADPDIGSVGYGGLPDADGNVTLDACIMDPSGDAGSVACIKEIMHPISVARKVMEKTPHVMLVGEGAQKFAEKEGFPRENLLTPRAKKAWEKEKALKNNLSPVGHDTIGLVGMDKSGDIAGACTTSGLGFKMPGRVGDSPIIGAGLYVDNEVGGAAATGWGELVMKTLGSFLVVELMRNGAGPEEACREALERIRRKVPLDSEHQVGYIALNKSGNTAGYCLREGFEYALHSNGKNHLIKAPSLL
ncbi:MAG TPA: glycosylasparaginase [Bacteroides sp.]|nr:glycosylasparaginase [Bacteroides sp.]